EEFALHDMEGLPKSFGEYVGLAAVAEFVELVEEFDHMDSDDLAAIYEDFQNIDELRTALNDTFVGLYDEFRDYADESADEMLAAHNAEGDNPLSRYFDYESFARDLRHDMRVIDLPTGNIAVFHA
ncbi:hypothetical protein G3A39_43185, partial [Paraburkholderia aspalathi]|nr:hypothetical protein [Paraburkholderia aspalathi]